MKHLNLESLAHLVERDPTPDEADHLASCTRCQEELDALCRQTESLSLLPSLRPPSSGWDELEARLRAEGLLQEDGRAQPAGRSRGRGTSRSPQRSGRYGLWHQLAAGVAILLVGMGLGMGLPGAGESSPTSSVAQIPTGTSEDADPLLALLDPATESPELTLEEVGHLVELTGAWHRTALTRYRERLDEAEGGTPQDPISRYAALEALMAAGRVAVREAPADPFLNGLLLNMQAERDATLRGLQAQSAGHNWY